MLTTEPANRHLTVLELASRWNCTRETVARKYRKLGLRPIRIAKTLLFPITQVEETERRMTIESTISEEE
jgi:hypothetical protein